MTAPSAGLANHRVPVMTNHASGGKPESVPHRTVKENDMTLDNEQIVWQAALATVSVNIDILLTCR